MAVRFLPQTVHEQECFCCSFILRRTASFSTLTRERRSSSPRVSQKVLMFSRSSWVEVFHMRSFFGVVEGGGGAVEGELLVVSSGLFFLLLRFFFFEEEEGAMVKQGGC